MKLECFSCEGYGHKQFKCPTAQRRKEEKQKGQTQEKRRYDIYRHTCTCLTLYIIMLEIMTKP